MSENVERIFECNLNDTNLFKCILNEIGESDLNGLMKDSPIITDETILNCINASLVLCLRNENEELKFPKVNVQASKIDNDKWLINAINIIVNEQIDEDIIYSSINQCLKFVKKGCDNDESIKFSIIKSKERENLKNYKVELLELNKWLNNIRDNKSKKEKLFILFKNIESN